MLCEINGRRNRLAHIAQNIAKNSVRSQAAIYLQMDGLRPFQRHRNLSRCPRDFAIQFYGRGCSVKSMEEETD